MNDQSAFHACDVEDTSGNAVRRGHDDESLVVRSCCRRDASQEPQSPAVEKLDFGEVNHDVERARDGPFDSWLEPRHGLEIDVSAETDDDAPLFVVSLHLGRWISHVGKPLPRRPGNVPPCRREWTRD